MIHLRFMINPARIFTHLLLLFLSNILRSKSFLENTAALLFSQVFCFIHIITFIIIAVINAFHINFTVMNMLCQRIF